MRRRALLLLLLLAVVAAQARVFADELLFGPPTGGGVATIPFDATQAPGCVAWDGITMLTHPENPICAGGGGGGTQPTQTPWDCGAGYYVQGVGSTPACVVVPTPDGGGSPQPTQTPWACGAGNYVQGLASSPQCQVVPTPDGAFSPFPTPTLVAFRNQANTFTGAQTITGEFRDTTGNVDLSCSSSGCAFADLTSGDQIVFERGGLYGNMALHSLTGGVVVADRWHTDPAACPSGQFCVDTDVTGACVCQALPTATPTLSPTPTPTATLAAGNAIDLTAGVIDFDATELTNFTVSAGASATASTTYNLSGSNDPVLTAKNAGFVIESSGIPVFQMDDTDQAAGSSPDWTSFINCIAGPACSYTMSHLITGGLSSAILLAGQSGAVQLGDALATSVGIVTDGTGNGELTVPNQSIGTAELTTTGVGAASCTNCNLTYDVDGRLTAASSGTNIPAGFALYVDKAGTDSASCGPLNAPCLTINGAFAIIRTNNDNGFDTCSGNNARGCGRCSVATSTVCNETSDCPGGETCTATNSVCSGLSLGTCTGPLKSYDVHVGVGDYYETLAAVCSGGSNAGKLCSEATCATGGGTCVDHAPPSPGYVLLVGNDISLTRVLNSDWATIDTTNRVAMNAGNITFTNLATTNGSALRSTGGWQRSIWRNVGLVFTGTDTTNSWGANITGSLNYTDSVLQPLIFAYATGGSNANGVHYQTYPTNVCTGNALRACDDNADCTATINEGTCTVLAKSADFYVQGGQIQPTGADGLSGTGVWIEGIACGNQLNQVLADTDVSGSSGGVGTTVGLKVTRTSCDTNSDASMKAAGYNRSIVRNLRIAGTHNPGLTDFDTPLSVDSNSKVQVMGDFTYNACTRSLGATTSVEYMNTLEFGGGSAELGVLNCTAPSTPINGECWYDALTDLRRECRINGSTVGMLTTDNLSQYDSQVCTNVCMGGTLSSTPTTLLTLASWTNTGQNTEITAKVQIDVSAARIVTCKLKNSGSTVETSTLNFGGTITTGTIPLHYFDNATGTQGPFTFTCETDSATGNGVATNASLVRVTSNVPSLATTSAQIAGWLSDETGTGALVFGTAPTISNASLTGDTLVTGRAIVGAAGTPVPTATPTQTSTAAPTPTGPTVTPTATTAATVSPTATPPLIVDGNAWVTQNISIGTSIPLAQLHTAQDVTAASGTIRGHFADQQLRGTWNGDGLYVGMDAQQQVRNNVQYTNGLIGVRGLSQHLGQGTVASITGVSAQAVNGGVISAREGGIVTTLRGGQFQAIQNTVAGTNTNVVGGDVSAANRSTSTTTNLLGSNISLDVRTGATVTNAVGLFVRGTDATAGDTLTGGTISTSADMVRVGDWNSGPTYPGNPRQLFIEACTAANCTGLANESSSRFGKRVDIGPTPTPSPTPTSVTPTATGATATVTPMPAASPVLAVHQGNEMLSDGHWVSRQTVPPSVGGCGTTPTQPAAGAASDSVGKFTVGSTATACVLTFVRTWTNAPKCFCNDETAATLTRCLVTTTTTTATFTTTTTSDISSDVIDYWCIGNE